MAGLLLVHAVVAVEIAADVAGGNRQAARRRDEDMGEILTDPALEREGFGGRRRGVGGIGVVGHIVVQALEHVMQEVEHVALGGVPAGGGKGGDARRRAW